jgi:hypothetical protein
MDNIVFYPNPVTDILHVKLSENAKVQVFSLAGELLMENNYTSGNADINMNDFSSGLYLVKIHGKTFRIVKN